MRVLLVSLVMVAAAAAEVPRMSIGHDHIEKLGVPGCSWDVVQDHLSVCQFQINAVAYLSPQDELKGLVDILTSNRIAIAIECGYFDWLSTMSEFSAPNPKGIHDIPRKELKPGVGAETARIEIAKLAPLLEAGGTPDVIVMDGPIRRLIDPDGGPFGYQAPGMSLEQAIPELVGYMKTWLRTFPDVEFVCITNFPNWAWKDVPAYRDDRKGHGDWYPCIRALVASAREESLPLTAIRADNPYEYAMGIIPVPWDASTVDWMARLADLERYAEGEGLEFQMTINSVYGGMASAAGFTRETLRFLGIYRASGGTPGLYMVHTWYPFPKALGPEDEPYTMTNLMKAVIEDFQGEPGLPLKRELAKPRTGAAHTVLDMLPPTETGGNSHADFAGTGAWSYWTASGSESPIERGPSGVTYEPMGWNGKPAPGRGYEADADQGRARMLLDHVERLEMIPYTGLTAVLRWTSRVARTVRLEGTWWMSAPGNMHLAIFVDGQAVVERRDYTETTNPGFAFARDIEVKPGSTIEFWADADGDPSHDTARLRATIKAE